MSSGSVFIKHRKAYFEYEILSEFEAGIVLQGSEVKSVRNNEVNITGSFAIIRNEEVFVLGLHIAKYKQAVMLNHEPLREKKLLLHSKEIKRLSGKIKTKGLTLIPLLLYVNKRGFIKMKLGLCKGKKLYDRRRVIKERDMERIKNREIKELK